MSVSSVESSPVSGDLQAKYQKLASEYAKLRAQCGVLKKAVVEEQARSVELKETLKQREQSLRKIEQEMDSLNFRNLQLTKRVTVLQDELDVAQKSKKVKVKNSGSDSANDTRNHVIDEELQKKIFENAQLAILLQEQKEKYERDKFELTNQIEIYEHDMNELKKQVNCLEERHKLVLTRKENENQILLQKMKLKDEEINNLKREIENINNAVNTEQNYFEILLSNLKNENIKSKWLSMLSTVPVSRLLNCLENFSKCYEENFSLLLERKVGDSCSVELYENFQPVRLIEESFNNLLSHLGNLEDYFEFSLEQIIFNINRYIEYQEKLFKYVRIKSSGEEKFTNWNCVDRLTEPWNHLNSCLKSFAQSNFENPTLELISVFQCAQKTYSDLASAFNSKAELENSIDLNKTNEDKLLHSIRNIAAACGDIYLILSQNGALLEQISKVQKPVFKQAFVEPVEVKPVLKPEQDCEHWKQEIQLMKISHSKKVKELEEQILSISGSSTPQSNGSTNVVQTPVQGSLEPAQLENNFGSLSAPLIVTLERDGYESEVKKYFTARTNNLVSDRQAAESKCTTLKSECEVLHKRLEHSLECNMVLEATLQQTKDTVNRLQEELTTTTSNYETQLSSMSEHMANMNDRVATQQEEIDQLTYLLQSKDTRRGRK